MHIAVTSFLIALAADAMASPVAQNAASLGAPKPPRNADPARVHKMPRYLPGLRAHLAARKRHSRLASLAEVERDTELVGAVPAYNGLRFQRSGKADGDLELIYSETGLDSRAKASDPLYTAHNFTQPLDHWASEHEHGTNVTFEQRYWFSTRHYNASAHAEGNPAPVFVLDSGETDAEGRLPYLDHGILDILTAATGGVGVVLEHRYYGKSIPERSALGAGDTWQVDQLRWLNNRQALEDSARFAREVKFPGIAEDLTAPGTPWIYYGGSYPGARAAHMRVLYPDIIFGAIASSAVVAAVDEYPEYMYPVARGAETSCSQTLQAAVAAIDSVLAPHGNSSIGDAKRIKQLQALFGLEDLKDPRDFANVLTYPLGSFQALNWDNNFGSTEWYDFCNALTNISSKYAEIEPSQKRAWVEDLYMPPSVHRLAKYINETLVAPCFNGEGEGPNAQSHSAEECFGSSDYSSFINETQLDDGKAWQFQVCTTWGYILTSPPNPEGNHSPTHPSGPKIVSSLIDYDYAAALCKYGYPAGEHFAIPARPNISEVNDIGGFQIAMDRLAFIDGQYDPWRPATTHSEEFASGGAREDTLDRPFKLIPDCWHHCDENSLPAAVRKEEPARIRAIHADQINFVQHWLSSWEQPAAKR